MAQNQIHTIFIFCLASSICMSSLLLVEANLPNLPTLTKITLYFHDYAFGPNATFFPVVGLPGKELNYTTYGTFFVTDDPVTETPYENATEIGRVQGMYVVSGVDGRNLLVLLSLGFTSGTYNGSSIEIQGTSRQFDDKRELPVIAGTGKFRFARGYINTDYYSYDASRGYSVMRVNVTVIA